MKKPKSKFRVIEHPLWEEMKEFWDWLQAQKFYNKISDRDFMVLCMFIWYGKRLHELAVLRLKDIHFTEGPFGRIYFMQQKKGIAEELAYPIIPQIKEYLVNYVNIYVKGFDDDRLFPLTDRRLQGIVYEHSEKFFLDAKGIKDQRYKTHSFRHAIGDYFNKTTGPAYAQYWLGHKDSRSTEKYKHTRYDYIEKNLPEEFK